MIHDINESIADWKTALEYLKSGNKRYCDGQPTAKAVGPQDRAALEIGQNPFAAIVTCSDSRVAPEVYFDQSLGDLFVIRNAGNIANDHVLGSIEFAVDALKVPLITIVGHTCCAAVINAFNDNKFPGKLQSVMDDIRPAIAHCDNEIEAIRANAANVVNQIRNNAIVKQYGTTVVAAFYDIKTGVVSFDVDVL